MQQANSTKPGQTKIKLRRVERRLHCCAEHVAAEQPRRRQEAGRERERERETNATRQSSDFQREMVASRASKNCEKMI